jgi:predicted RNase H-like HicB family nuclease
MRNMHYTLYREDSDYVAQCLDFDVSSFGATEQDALHQL